MSEVIKFRKEIDNLRDDLLKAMVTVRQYAELGRKSRARQEALLNEIMEKEYYAGDLKECFNHVVSIYKNVESYLNEKKASGEEALKLAIKQAGTIVPDADSEGIQLIINHDKGEVYIADKDGIDINDKEGGAYRTVNGLLIRYTIVKSLPNAIPLIAFDESFAACSDETSVRLRGVVDLLKEDIIFLGIEQSSKLYEGIDRKVLSVQKINGVSTIKEGI